MSCPALSRMRSEGQKIDNYQPEIQYREGDHGNCELYCQHLASDKCVSWTDLCDYSQILTTFTDQVSKSRPEEARRYFRPCNGLPAPTTLPHGVLPDRTGCTTWAHQPDVKCAVGQIAKNRECKALEEEITSSSAR